jgi:hypothetical protein
VTSEPALLPLVYVREGHRGELVTKGGSKRRGRHGEGSCHCWTGSRTADDSVATTCYEQHVGTISRRGRRRLFSNPLTVSLLFLALDFQISRQWNVAYLSLPFLPCSASFAMGGESGEPETRSLTRPCP